MDVRSIDSDDASHQSGEAFHMDPSLDWRFDLLDEEVCFRCSRCSKLDPKGEAQSSFKNGVQPSLPFSLNYSYTCAACSPSGFHEFQEKSPSVVHLCITALANLTKSAVRRGLPSPVSFSTENHIIPFIEHFWDRITSTPPKSGEVWKNMIPKAMMGHPGVFQAVLSDSGEVGYRLTTDDLDLLSPYHYGNIMNKGGMPAAQQSAASSVPEPVKQEKDSSRHSSPKVSKLKKKPSVQPTSAPKPNPFASVNLFPTGFPPTADLPVDPSGCQYRYVLTECDRNNQSTQEYLQNPELWHGANPQRHIRGDMYRAFIPPIMQLSTQEKAPQLILDVDCMTVTGDKGYSLIRATHSVGRGRYYFEFTVLDLPENAAVRAGWGTRHAALQAPLGYDQFGYSWRSRKGTIFHGSRGKHYSEGYGAGDVLGCYIELPFTKEKGILPDSYKIHPVVKFKNHIYYEVKEDQKPKPSVLKGSKIVFFKNGKPNGVAFSEIFVGDYFPAISLYKHAKVRVNFGPAFKYSPPNYTFLPVCERAVDASCEQTLSEVVYTVDWIVKTESHQEPKSKRSRKSEDDRHERD